jgi:hypothetical protein
MAKKTKAEATPSDKKKQKAAEGVKQRLTTTNVTKTFEADTTEKKVIAYLNRRIEDMIDYRRGLGVENRWREADEEYIPHELDFGTTRKRFETDQDTGLRSRMVPVGDITQQWRQASSAPTLLAKIQTACSIIVSNQPEGRLTALLKKYQKTTDLAYSLWKRNWHISDAKEKLKVFLFDLIKYGWAVERVYPRKVEYDKRVLVETDPENPENDKYEEKKLLWYNDVDRQNLSVYNTWIDELAKPYDTYSRNEDYFELDYSYDQAKVEFGQYSNFEFVKPDSQMTRETEKRKSNRTDTNVTLRRRKDIVTIGFFESRHKDLFVIWVPKDKITLSVGPMPNDDGYLSVVDSLWLLRKNNLPYGVSLWEVIRQNKSLYDKMKNMTMDQLVLSIMKFGFFSGTNTAVGDGKIEIVPGQARQLTSSTGKPEVNWMEIPGPGKEAWAGLEAVQDMMDDESGISPTLEGDVTGKTLGEILHAKDAALKRLKMPVDNLAWAIEQDAYITLSWMGQLYAIPQIKEFASLEEMMAFQKEEQIEHVGDIFGTQEVDESGQPSLDETGAPKPLTGPFKAQYFPQLSLHLEDKNGELFEGKDSKFFQVGKDIMPGQLKWRGIFKVIPRSIVDSSQDLIKAVKTEVFNIIVPLLQFPPQLVGKAVKQLLTINEEDPDDWLPDEWVKYLKTGELPPPPAAPAAPGEEVNPAAPASAPVEAGGTSGTVQNGAGTAAAPVAPTVVPAGETGGPAKPSMLGNTGGSIFNKRLQ